MVHGGGGACVSHLLTTTHSFIKKEKKNVGIKEERDGEEGNESVITWAAPRVMNHGSGGMRLDGSRWLWCLRLASPNNNAQLHKEGEEERGNKGGKRWRRG
ncbi:hypothetical protein F2Q68_00010891 [Brassica cretica]|uniref:Uncharacterized protein n=1 Tax=Brassica cretica TaxID=69181 RepID=A0A8S9KYN5_BRACR|nr:hypothetical protein F2Q68_00010891 [Brassica cretica]